MDMSLRDQIRENTKTVGVRICEARSRKGMSQSELGATLGVTFQQVQKYEKGKTRVSVASLIAIADALDMDIGFFLPSRLLPAGQSDVEIARQESAASLAAIDDAIAILSRHRFRLGAAAGRLGSTEA